MEDGSLGKSFRQEMNSGPWDKKEKVGTTPSADRIKRGEVNESKSQREELPEGGSGFW